jgi:hypothetical protein
MNLLIDFSNETEKQKLWKVLKSRKAVKYSIEIKRYQPNRSSHQNRYYWGVMIDLLSNHTGYEPEEMHDFLKRKFNPKEISFKVTGETMIIGGSTTKMDTVDFMNYVEQIQRWALNELDVYIPDPNEQ